MTVQPSRRVPAFGVLAGAAAVVIGVLLPWISVHVPILGTYSRSGVHGGAAGGICVLIAVLAALATLRLMAAGDPAGRGTRAIAVVISAAGAACLALAVYAGRTIDNRISDVLDGVPMIARHAVSADAGAGVYVAGAGGALIMIAGLAWLRPGRTPPAP